MIGQAMPIEKTIQWLKYLNERVVLNDGQIDNIFHVTAENAINYLETERHARWINERVIDDLSKRERMAKVEKVDTNSPHSQVYKCCKCGQYTHRTAWSRDVHYCPSCGARLEWK